MFIVRMELSGLVRVTLLYASTALKNVTCKDVTHGIIKGDQKIPLQLLSNFCYFIKIKWILTKETAMSADSFDEEETDVVDCNSEPAVVVEASPSTKLARRRKIEDLFEEKRLQEELAEFG